MKVTVCINDTKIVVPCGDGDLSIRQLAELAIIRYKKTASKILPDKYLEISSLKLARDGGILDWDDKVHHVLDDRDLLIAQNPMLVQTKSSHHKVVSEGGHNSTTTDESNDHPVHCMMQGPPLLSPTHSVKKHSTQHKHQPAPLGPAIAFSASTSQSRATSSALLDYSTASTTRHESLDNILLLDSSVENTDTSGYYPNNYTNSLSRDFDKWPLPPFPTLSTVYSINTNRTLLLPCQLDNEAIPVKNAIDPLDQLSSVVGDEGGLHIAERRYSIDHPHRQSHNLVNNYHYDDANPDEDRDDDQEDQNDDDYTEEDYPRLNPSYIVKHTPPDSRLKHLSLTTGNIISTSADSTDAGRITTITTAAASNESANSTQVLHWLANQRQDNSACSLHASDRNNNRIHIAPNSHSHTHQDNAQLQNTLLATSPTLIQPHKIYPSHESTLNQLGKYLNKQAIPVTIKIYPPGKSIGNSTGVSGGGNGSSSSSGSSSHGNNLGIHISPHYLPEHLVNSQELHPDFPQAQRSISGINVHTIMPEGRVAKEHLLNKGELIIEINDTKLLGLSYERAECIFRESLNLPSAKECRIKVVPCPASAPPTRHLTPANPPPQPPRRSPHTALSPTSLSAAPNPPATTAPIPHYAPPVVHTSAQIHSIPQSQPPLPPLLEQHIIHLTKSGPGFGFSITTNSVEGGPISSDVFVRHILKDGAAIKDGRLRSGDKLLEIDGLILQGMSQTEVISLLREKPNGSRVKLLVERQLATVRAQNYYQQNKHLTGLGFGYQTPRGISSSHESLATGSLLMMSESGRGKDGGSFYDPDNDDGVMMGGRGGCGNVTDSAIDHGSYTDDNYCSHDGDEDDDDDHASSTLSKRKKSGGGCGVTRVLQFDIPLTSTHSEGNSTGPVTLGVSVKVEPAKYFHLSSADATQSDIDAANVVYVRTLIEDGAAYRDGKLKVGDRLLKVNNQVLSGLSSEDALSRLKSIIKNAKSSTVRVEVSRRLQPRSNSLTTLNSQSMLSCGSSCMPPSSIQYDTNEVITPAQQMQHHPQQQSHNQSVLPVDTKSGHANIYPNKFHLPVDRQSHPIRNNSPPQPPPLARRLKKNSFPNDAVDDLIAARLSTAASQFPQCLSVSTTQQQQQTATSTNHQQTATSTIHQQHSQPPLSSALQNIINNRQARSRRSLTTATTPQVTPAHNLIGSARHINEVDWSLIELVPFNKVGSCTDSNCTITDIRLNQLSLASLESSRAGESQHTTATCNHQTQNHPTEEIHKKRKKKKKFLSLFRPSSHRHKEPNCNSAGSSPVTRRKSRRGLGMSASMHHRHKRHANKESNELGQDQYQVQQNNSGCKKAVFPQSKSSHSMRSCYGDINDPHTSVEYPYADLDFGCYAALPASIQAKDNECATKETVTTTTATTATTRATTYVTSSQLQAPPVLPRTISTAPPGRYADKVIVGMVTAPNTTDNIPGAPISLMHQGYHDNNNNITTNAKPSYADYKALLGNSKSNMYQAQPPNKLSHYSSLDYVDINAGHDRVGSSDTIISNDDFDDDDDYDDEDDFEDIQELVKTHGFQSSAVQRIAQALPKQPINRFVYEDAEVLFQNLQANISAPIYTSTTGATSPISRGVVGAHNNISSLATHDFAGGNSAYQPLSTVRDKYSSGLSRIPPVLTMTSPVAKHYPVLMTQTTTVTMGTAASALTSATNNVRLPYLQMQYPLEFTTNYNVHHNK